jgi:hypothetical protein
MKKFLFFISFIFLISPSANAQSFLSNNKDWCASNYINPSIGPGCVKVPGPIGVAGGAIAFGFSRKLRQRIKNSKKE